MWGRMIKLWCGDQGLRKQYFNKTEAKPENAFAGLILAPGLHRTGTPKVCIIIAEL